MATNSTRPRSSHTTTHNHQTKRNTQRQPAAEDSTRSSANDEYLRSLKSQYAKQLSSLRELFSETWNDEDLVAVLQEVEGDLDTAILRISEGFAQQWSKQGKKSKKDGKKADSSNTVSEHVFDSRKDGSRPPPRSMVTSGRGRGRGRGGSSRGGYSGRVASSAHSHASNTSASLAQPTTASPALNSQRDQNSWSAKVAASSVAANDNAWAVNNDSKVAEWSSLSNASDVKLSEWPTSKAQELSEANWADSSWKSETTSHADNWSVEAAASTTSWTNSPNPVPAASSVNASSIAVPKPARKGTWAEIAKPEPSAQSQPVSTATASSTAPIEKLKVRDQSPKRFVEAATSVDSSPNRIAPSISSPQKTTLLPPGLVKQRDLSPSRGTPATSSIGTSTAAPKIIKKKDSPVVMPNTSSTAAASAVSNVGVTFGSLSLNSDTDAILDSSIVAAKKATPSVAQSAAPGRTAATGPQSGFLKDQNIVGGTTDASAATHISSTSSPVVSQFFQQQTTQTTDFGGIYDRQATSLMHDPQLMSQPHLSTPHHQNQNMGYPPGIPANMANMYAAAAYFPIYMNHLSQFGGNPYAAAFPQQPSYPISPNSTSVNLNSTASAGNKAASAPTGTTGYNTTSTGSNIYGASTANTTSGNTTSSTQTAAAANAKQMQSNPLASMYNAYYGGASSGTGGVSGATGASLMGGGYGGDDALAAHEFVKYQNAYLSHLNSQNTKTTATGGMANTQTSQTGMGGNNMYNAYQFMHPGAAPSYNNYMAQMHAGQPILPGGNPGVGASSAAGRTSGSTPNSNPANRGSTGPNKNASQQVSARKQPQGGAAANQQSSQQWNSAGRN